MKPLLTLTITLSILASSVGLFLSSMSAVLADAASTTAAPTTFYSGYSPIRFNVTKDIATNQVLPALANGISAVLVGISVIMLIYVGIQYLIAAGNEEQLDKARTNLMWIIAAIGVIMFAYAAVFLFLNLFG